MAQNQKIVFISDIHLGMGDRKSEEEREQRLIDFLKGTLHKGDRLFIVGDLFDFWFEYKTVIPKDFIRILSCLRELTEQGIRIDYIAGNHDFWAGDFFQNELGLNFHPEPLRERIGDKTFYIIHGDGLKRSDSGYRFLKRILRKRINIFLYRWVHPDIGIPFAKWCSGSSRKFTSNKDFGDEREYIDFAQNLFKNGVDHVIMGHTHRPYEHVTEDGKSLVNLGDWIEHNTYARFHNNTLTTHIFKSG